MSCKSLLLLLCVTLGCFTVHASPPWSNDGHEDVESLLVRKDERVSLASTEYGEISAVHIGDGERGSRYYLQFITLEPNALFLPVLLHADMVFYVHSGAGRLSWADEDGKTHETLRSGDVFSLRPGSIFFLQSNLETERRKLRIYAIFTNSHDNLHEPAMGPYSSIRDLILGFDKEVLRAAFQVPKEMIDELTSGTRQPAIVHASTTEKKGKSLWEINSQYLEVILGRGGNMFEVNKKKYGTKTFNLFDQKPDFKNRYGHSLIVNKKNLPSLKRPNLSVFLVNLTAGSMMGPHWNPMASEVSIVLQGEGMITVVGPSTKSDSENHQSTRFPVGEGDVFVVPRLHPMAQIAFNNNSFAFMGFSSTTKKNHPQYLAGKASVLRTLEKRIVAMSFGATNMSAFDWLMDQQGESVILECASCAEEEFRRIEEEMKRRREKEEKRRREEEERKREEEEKKRREEEEAKRREEEAEAARREEEARKQREEEAKREEEEARRQEEKRKRREEEESRRREEEEEARRKEEEEQRRRQEEEEAERREEEARRRREEEATREEEEARRQEEERMQREEKEARTREKEERQKREEEEQARQQEEEAMRRREEEARREEEERRQREEEEASAREEEERHKREKEEERSEEEERQRREEEEEASVRKEEERARRHKEEKSREEKSEEEEEATRRGEEEAKIREKEARERRKEAARREEEEARGQEEKSERREEEESRRREEEEEETREREEGGGGDGDEERRRLLRRMWKLSDF